MAKRLTLRKLMGYLDDSLEPAKAKEIGQRIAEDESARELIERIRAVTRRRRLAAPQVAPAPGELDPNDVAEYLDRVLPSEVWPQVEQQILESDTALAETACVHQTTSLGQGLAGDISDEAWEQARSIVGVKGMKSHSTNVAQQPFADQEPHSYLTQTIPLAVPPAPSSGGMGNRVLTLALVFLLAVGLGWGIYKTLAPPSIAPGDGESLVAEAATQLIPIPQGDSAPVDLEVGAQARQPEQLAVAKTTTADSAPGESTPTKAEAAPVRIQLQIPEEPLTVRAPDAQESPKQPVLASAAPQPKSSRPPKPIAPESTRTEPTTIGERTPPPPPTPALPPASTIDESIPLATVTQPTLLLFRRAGGKLERMRSKAFAYLNDELLNPDGFHSKLESSARCSFELLDQTKLRLLQPRGVDLAFELNDGMVLVDATERPATIYVQRDKIHARVRLSTGGQVGFEAIFDGGPTKDSPFAVPVESLAVLVIRGQVEVSLGASPLKVLGGTQTICRSDGTMSRPSPIIGNLPGRHKESSPELRAAQSFAAMIPYSERIGMTLRGEMDERNREMRKLAVRCMGAVEETAGLAVALGAEKSPDSRHAAMIVSRQLLRREPQLRAPFTTSLKQSYSEEDAQTLIDLLLGYSAKAQADIETYTDLVDLLESEQLAVREAAITNLRDLTGRDFQYAADATVTRRKTALGQWRRWLEDQSDKTLPPKKSR